jgi:hypothetical protein
VWVKPDPSRAALYEDRLRAYHETVTVLLEAVY